VATENKHSKLRELFDAMPLYFIFVMGWGILHYELANVSPELFAQTGHDPFWFRLMVVIPLAWFLLGAHQRIRLNPGVENKRRAFAITATISTAILVATVFLHRDNFLETGRIVAIYEYSQFGWFALFAYHAWRTQGTARMVTFFGVCFLYGLILENSGILIGYFGESHYRHYIGFAGLRLPAPIATQFGWAIMFYVATWMAELIAEKRQWLARSPIRMAVFTSLLATSLDFQIDPMASLSGVWWSWNPALPAWFLGVPFLNFAAWFVAFLPFTFAYYSLQEKYPDSPWRMNRGLLLRVPWMLPAAMLIGWPLIVIRQGGFSGPEVTIFVEFLHKLLPY
jgi:Carotenoid biosynthesis protein